MRKPQGWLIIALEMKGRICLENQRENIPEEGKILKIDLINELFLNPFGFELKFPIFENLYERVDALRHHSSFVICDHQWRPRLS